MNESTLVIGGSGFIGSALISSLRDSRIINGTSRSTKERESHLGLIKLDLFDSTNWNEVLKNIQPKTVICTAWETEYREYWNKTTNLAYSKAIEEFAIACFSNSVEKFVGIGSMSEYGFSPGACMSGVTPLNPQDLYSETKIQTSIAVKKRAQEFGKNSMWLRLFQPYGPFENHKRLIPSVIKSLMDNGTALVNYPSHTLDFLTVQDTAEAIKFVLGSDTTNEIDIGSGIPMSVEELLRVLANIMDVDWSDIHFEEQNRSHERTIFVDPKSEIFARGWGPLSTLQQGLKDYVKWGEENHLNLRAKN